MDSSDWDERYAAAELVWGAEPNRWLVREAAGLAPGTALDLGAGEGRNSIWLAAQGWQVTAVDFSGVALERGRRLAAGLPGGIAERLTWVHRDVLAYRPEPAAFDLVLLAYLHLPATERTAVLRRAACAVAHGGALLVIGHDTANLTEGVGGPQDVRVLFTAQDVLDDVRGLGLLTVRAERVRRPVRTVGGESRQAVDALVHLRVARP